jgi:hypothetical protein
METFQIKMVQRTTWEFELEADSEEHAELLTQDWGRDELDEDEITDNCWEIEIV